MSEKTSETKATGTGVRIWTGKLRLNEARNKEGKEVRARVISTGAAAVFEVNETETGDACWRLGDPGEIHAASWLRALGATGSEVG